MMKPLWKSYKMGLGGTGHLRHAIMIRSSTNHTPGQELSGVERDSFPMTATVYLPYSSKSFTLMIRISSKIRCRHTTG